MELVFLADALQILAVFLAFVTHKQPREIKITTFTGSSAVEGLKQ